MALCWLVPLALVFVQYPKLHLHPKVQGSFSNPAWILSPAFCEAKLSSESVEGQACLLEIAERYRSRSSSLNPLHQSCVEKDDSLQQLSSEVQLARAQLENHFNEKKSLLSQNQNMMSAIRFWSLRLGSLEHNGTDFCQHNSHVGSAAPLQSGIQPPAGPPGSPPNHDDWPGEEGAMTMMKRNHGIWWYNITKRRKWKEYGWLTSP